MTWSKFFNALPYAFLYIASIAIIGLINLLSVEEQVDFWTDAEFWNRTISQNIASALTLTATISLYIDRLRERHEKYIELKSDVERHIREDVEADFGEWSFNENKRVKIATYTQKVRGKIAKKERRTRAKNLQIWYEGTEEEKQKNRYCRRRKRLEDTLKPERLDKRIFSIKLDYDEIDRNFVETGQTKGMVKQRAKQDNIWRKLKDNSPRFLFGFAAVAFFNAYIYTVKSADAEFWYRFAYGFGVLIWMFIQGKLYANSYMEHILISDLNTRFNILKDYFAWKVSIHRLKEAKNG